MQYLCIIFEIIYVHVYIYIYIYMYNWIYYNIFIIIICTFYYILFPINIHHTYITHTHI